MTCVPYSVETVYRLLRVHKCLDAISGGLYRKGHVGGLSFDKVRTNNEVKNRSWWVA